MLLSKGRKAVQGFLFLILMGLLGEGRREPWRWRNRQKEKENKIVYFCLIKGEGDCYIKIKIASFERIGKRKNFYIN